jgi:hypothetical protein
VLAGDATTGCGGRGRRARLRDRTPTRSGTLPGTMLVPADALGFTLALLATFLGIGVVVNVLIVYIVGQVLAERKQNQERQQGFQ